MLASQALAITMMAEGIEKSVVMSSFAISAYNLLSLSRGTHM